MSGSPPPDGRRAQHEMRDRASSFGDNAELYDRSRPTYPDELLDGLAAAEPVGVLDVGCGTGILARALVARGLDVTGVEPDERMAVVARSHGLSVEVSPFEAWDPAGRRFGLVASGQAWHWVDPVQGTSKAAEVLTVGGVLALIWNDARMDDELQGSLDRVYERLATPGVAPTVRHRPGDWLGEAGSEKILAASDSFSDLSHRTYPWSREYTTAAWIAQLETHSDHRAMDDHAREALLSSVAAAIDELGGRFTMAYDCRLTAARRR